MCKIATWIQKADNYMMTRKNILFLGLVLLLILFASYALGLRSGNNIQQIDHYELSDTILYSGQFRDGLFDGNGILDLGDGYRYEGGFVAGRFDGEGTLRFDGESPENSWRFEGVFKEGVAVSGDYIFGDGQVVNMNEVLH